MTRWATGRKPWRTCAVRPAWGRRRRTTSCGPGGWTKRADRASGMMGYAQHLSLSRLNHRLPGCETHPEVMQGTTDFHHQIADTRLPQTDPVFDNAAALHTAVDVLDPEPALVQGLVGPLLLQRELLAAGFLGRHEDLHLRERERQEAQIL